MGSLVEVIARALVSKPDEVKVTEETDGKEILVKLQVADEDIGKIIGKSTVCAGFRQSEGGQSPPS